MCDSLEKGGIRGQGVWIQVKNTQTTDNESSDGKE